jgi:hypothetical protein
MHEVVTAAAPRSRPRGASYTLFAAGRSHRYDCRSAVGLDGVAEPFQR